MEHCNSLQLTCHHCSNNHLTASDKCPEFKYQKEILLIQRRNKTSRAQAKLQLDSKQPQFRKSFAEAVQNNNKNLQPTNLTYNLIETNEMEDESANSKRKRSISIEKNSKGDKKHLVEAVCVHPDSSILFTTPVEVYNPTNSELSEIDITSENNFAVRKRAQNISDQY